MLIFTINLTCFQEALEDLEALADSEEECPVNNNLQLKRRKSIQPNIMNYLQSIKKLLQNKSEKLSEEKLSKNILTKEVILINSKKLHTHMKFLPILKKDNCTINMESKEYKMVDLQVELVASVISSASSEAEARDKEVPEKQSQSWLKSKLHWTKFIMDAWRM